MRVPTLCYAVTPRPIVPLSSTQHHSPPHGPVGWAAFFRCCVLSCNKESVFTIIPQEQSQTGVRSSAADLV